MLASLGLAHYSSFEVMWICGIAAVAAVVVGYLTDMMMGDRGFGPFGNGALVAMGALAGVHYRNFVFGPMVMYDTFAISMAGSCMAAAMLLCFGMVKRWVRS